ncbi:MAG: 3-ketoacyl-CoA thiolase [Syntrophorhabdus sp. PtaU1.Bin153]|nr:MAG: 3-ketoacyl-CoA thiolase [Syntrophorhabdus sp. PtaU1.Bin153]
MGKPSLRRVAVIGVGMSKFGKQPDKTIVELGTEACRMAIKDAGISPKAIEVSYCANQVSVQCITQEIGSKVGIVNGEMVRVENGCAGGSTAVREVFYAIATGRFDIGMAIGVDSMTTAYDGPLVGNDIDGQSGKSTPAWAAFSMRHYMNKYGVGVEPFAQASVKNHRNGALNPFAMYQREFSMEEILNSRMVCDPLTLFMICPTTDGAAAVILCAEEKVAQFTSTPVWLAGSALKTGGYTYFWKEIDVSDACEQAAAEAYEMAGIGPEDVDLIELHDAFAGTEIPNIEDLGVCGRGEAAHLMMEGVFDIGGKIPVNPSGGLLAQGHPLAASGVRQVCELTWHLRDQAGKRQVKGAKVGVAHMEGGVVTGLQVGACGINILVR